MKFFPLLPILFLVVIPMYAQNLPTLEYLGQNSSLNNLKVEGDFLGGLSAITYDKTNDRYYAITDNSQNALKNNSKKSIIFSFKIDLIDEQIEVSDVKSFSLKNPIDKINGESIRLVDEGFIVADEADDNSRILKVSNEGIFLEEIYEADEMSHNRGFEGMALSANGQFLFFALERPVTIDAVRGNEEHLGVVPVYQYDLIKKEMVGEYIYPLHLPQADLTDKQQENFKKDNGITELLLYNDSTLLFLERAFLGGTKKKLNVRIYAATFSENKNLIYGNFDLLKPEKIFDLFTGNLPFEVDNVEGMSFDKQKKHLYLISDDNFDRYGEQITQIIGFKIN